jgi:hypothetical protein
MWRDSVRIPDEADQRSGMIVDHDSGLKPICIPGESDYRSGAKPINDRA